MTITRKIDLERGARIKHVRAEILGLRSQQALADMLSKEGKEVTRGAVGNWETGKEVGLESLVAISRLAGVRLEWLASNDGAMRAEPVDSPQIITELPFAPEPSNAIITGVTIEKGIKIPLYGSAVGGEDGQFILNGNRLDDVFAPRSLSGIGDAYAVQIAGDSMSPRYEDGDTVYVNPRRRPVKGDYVVAQIHIDETSPPHAYIKKLVRRTERELVLEQFNPHKTLIFDGNQVASIHYVLRPGE